MCKVLEHFKYLTEDKLFYRTFVYLLPIKNEFLSFDCSNMSFERAC